MATKKNPTPATPATASTTAAPKTKPAVTGPTALAPTDTAPPNAKLAQGDAAPAFQLPDEAGTVRSLGDFAGKTVVLYFYPKDDTPGCTRQACAFQESLAVLTKGNVVVLGVSRDSAASHVRFKAKYGLAFPLLVDQGALVHRLYGAWGTKTLYGKTSEGALRTTVIIDPTGHVHRVFSSVKVDGHVEKVRAALP